MKKLWNTKAGSNALRRSYFALNQISKHYQQFKNSNGDFQK